MRGHGEPASALTVISTEGGNPRIFRTVDWGSLLLITVKVEQEEWQVSHKSSEKSEMSDVSAASELIRNIVPVNAGATVKQRIMLTARKLGWHHNRTRDVWYEQARRINACEMDALREAKRAREMQGARGEYRELRARIARLEMAVAVAHPTLDRDEIAEIERRMRGPSGMDRSGADGD